MENKEAELRKLFDDWKSQIAKKTDIKHSDGKFFPTTEYFSTDGNFPGYWQSRKKVCFIGREARYKSGNPDVTISEIRKDSSKLLNFYRRIFYIEYGIQHEGKIAYNDIPYADEIFKQFDSNNNFGFSFVNISKYTNDADDGADRNIPLMTRALEDSELDKRNFFQEELEILDPEVIITMDIFDTGVNQKYIDLCFNSDFLEKDDSRTIPGVADVYKYQLNGKKIVLIDLYHFAARKNNEKYYYNPVMNILFGKKSVCKVDFNSKGGSRVESQELPIGERVSEPEETKRAGYVFCGWFYDEEVGGKTVENSYDFSTPVTNDLKLRAKWIIKINPLILKVIGVIIGAVILVLLILFLLRCCTPQPPVETKIPVEPQPPEVEYDGYTVRSGDTYYLIADRKYNDRHFWPYLYNENKELHNDPDCLEINDNLRLPKISSGSEEFKKYVEYNKSKVVDAFMNSYTAYNDVDKHFRAVRALASGEIISEGMLNEVKSKYNISEADYTEAEKSVADTKEFDER